MNIAWRSIMDQIGFRRFEASNVDGLDWAKDLDAIFQSSPHSAQYAFTVHELTTYKCSSCPRSESQLKLLSILPVDLVHLTGPDSIDIGAACPHCESLATATCEYYAASYLLCKTDQNIAPVVDVVPILRKQWVFSGRRFVVTKMFELNEEIVSEVTIPERLPDVPWRLRIVIILLESGFPQ